jgi:hypothetical protein
MHNGSHVCGEAAVISHWQAPQFGRVDTLSY